MNPIRWRRVGSHRKSPVPPARRKHSLGVENLEDRSIPSVTPIESQAQIVQGGCVNGSAENLQLDDRADVDGLSEYFGEAEPSSTPLAEDHGPEIFEVDCVVGVNETGDVEGQKLEQDTTAFSRLLREELGEVLQDESKFHALLQKVFGDYDREAAEAFRQAVLHGDESSIPLVEFLDRQTLQGANGAYNGREGMIYLAADLKGNSALLRQTLVEETGHHLDKLLKQAETRGDEGELFRRLASAEKVGAKQIAEVRAENDHGVIQIAGQQIDVEFSLWGRIKKTAKDVGGHIKGGAKLVGTALDAVLTKGSLIIEKGSDLVEKIGKFPLKILPPGLEEVVTGAYSIPFKVARSGLHTGTQLGRSLINTAFNRPWEFLTLQAELDALSIAFHGATDIVSEILGQARNLTAQEKEFLRKVYGRSIDLDAIRIYEKDISSQLGFRAHVIGNHIYLPAVSRGQGNYDMQGNLTSSGLVLLAHEAGHVWQSQNSGNDYIHRSLEASQFGANDKAYDYITELRINTPFEDWNPEQQAHLIEDIAETVLYSGVTFGTLPTTATKAALAFAMGDEDGNGVHEGGESPVSLTDDDFFRAMAIWNDVRAGRMAGTKPNTTGILPPSTGGSVAGLTATTSSVPTSVAHAPTVNTVNSSMFAIHKANPAHSIGFSASNLFVALGRGRS